MSRGSAARFAILLPLALGGCDTTDWAGLADYYDHAPRTIVVLPSRNLTTDAEAPQFFLSTIGKPLIDRGYYILPVELTSEVLAHEGIVGEQAWEIEPHRLLEYFGADAALYVTIENWDTAYAVVASSVTVGLLYTLIDTRSGEVLWERRSAYSASSGIHGASIVGLIAGAVDAALTAATVQYVSLAREANLIGLSALPPGRYHPEYDGLMRKIADWKSAQENRNSP